MPTAVIVKHELERLLGVQKTDEEFESIFADLGMELEEVVMQPERGLEKDGPVKHYCVDVTANRPDILSVEGMAVALRPFLELGEPLNIYAKDSGVRVKVDPSVGAVRPYVVAAIVRDVHFTQTSFNSFIDYQDKLHHNLCRKRTLVAIGTHDLDKIDTSNIAYMAQPPADIVFQALNQTKEMDSDALFQVLKKDRQLSAYLHIIRDSPQWPVIRDGRGQVLSLPPIINSEYSKVELSTTNLFIECTATDLNKASAALNNLISSIRMQTRKKNEVETVEVIYNGVTENQQQLPRRPAPKYSYPDIAPCPMQLNLASLSRVSGIPLESLTVETVQRYLKRCSIGARVLRSGATLGECVLTCSVPFYRQDIIAEADLIESVCISYGYSRIAELHSALPNVMTIGSTLPGFRVGEMVRAEAVACGYMEMVLFSLCPAEDRVFSDMPVELANTKTAMFTHARSCIAPGLLRTMSAHQHASLPLKFFEVADIIVPRDNPEDDLGISAVKTFACIYGGTADGFEIVHGTLDHIMTKLKREFKLIREDHATCLPGRRAAIQVDGVTVGWIGVIHPTELLRYKTPIPCTILELSLE